MPEFRLATSFSPTGDQPQAIDALVQGLRDGQPYQCLLGVTGSGKTFTVANVVERLQRPTLVIAHNKTLAAQLFSEFKDLFPDNAVEYFVSYYDYYQPEAYVPKTDTYIEKDAMINERIDKMRHSATRSLLDREDVLIVASVSCIYGLGSPEAYHGMLVYLEVGLTIDRDAVLAKLVEIQYERSEWLDRGRFRVRGDVLDIFPVYEDAAVVRVEFFGDEVDSLTKVDPLTGATVEQVRKVTIYPATHYVVGSDDLGPACDAIEKELEVCLEELRGKNKLLEAQRLEQRTRYDLELLRTVGVCSGIENYSRHLEGRPEGSTPPTLMDYLPQDALIVIDESHATVPQMEGMYKGDRSRKETLVKHGFRLPSALDNRPLKAEEQERILTLGNRQVLYVSATPGDAELTKTGGEIVEQIIRPTGLTDPQVEVRPAKGQVEDLFDECKRVIDKGWRVLVTTLTKKMAEELSDYYREQNLRVRYLHSDIDTIERTEIIKDLRIGRFDVLVGINLLREGLDIPEVALVAILDADKEGFLRSARSLIQTSGRAARNADGRVIMYADRVTDSMRETIDETNRRREIQEAYNEEHGITPTTIVKPVGVGIEAIANADYVTVDVEWDNSVRERLRRADEKGRGRRGRRKAAADGLKGEFGDDFAAGDIPKRISALKKDMLNAAERLEFERAAVLRDEIQELEKLQLELL